MSVFWSGENEKKNKKIFPKSWNEISIKNASFDYKNNENEKTGIKEINMIIKKGEKIGLVGKSGSGKSTLVKVLIGLYSLNRGNIKIDDMDFSDIKEESILKHMSLVLQETEMFNLSLKENVTLMKKDKLGKFNNAVQIAELRDVIENLPEKENTLIGEKGYHLSGGERQRVGIARTIFKNPQIIILDEATSSLDSKTEQKIQESLEKEAKNKTLIMIAHRVSTLKNVDRIYVMEGGRIIEEGKYNELIADSRSKFYEIYELQQKKYKND
jgi:ABC-type multidrug transport system fused ATPase/permease subunit